MGALKLSNLLQVVRFEEDLNISRVRLQSRPRPASRPPAIKADEIAEEKRIEPEDVVAALWELTAQF